MKQTKRIYYTESQKSLMWDRWQRGGSQRHIAALFDRRHSSVQGIQAESGGIRPPATTTLGASAELGRAGGLGWVRYLLGSPPARGLRRSNGAGPPAETVALG